MSTAVQIGLGVAAGAAVVGGVIWYRRRQRIANVITHRRQVEVAAQLVRSGRFGGGGGYPL